MRYRILGATEAYDEQGATLPVGGRRLRALLAALALNPHRTVPAETLIAEVWASDDPPADAPAALQALIGRLRRAIGKDAIASTPGGYRLTATPEDIDLHRFERLVREGKQALARHDPAAASRTLREALALWRHPALADLPDRSAATRPEALLAEATRARVEADLLLGHASDVVPELKELTTVQPYDEPLHALLIRALRDAGRGADALAAYENARRTLAEGLGADPGPELRALYVELLDGGTPGAPGAPGTSGAPGTPPAKPLRKGNLRPRLTSFVGREPELAAIRSDMQRARLVTLTGPGGSGKTRLAEEAAAGHPQAWLAELAPLDQPEAVPGAVVSALGLRETVLMTSELVATQNDPVALLVEYCASRGLLLILDNCEHVIGAAADLAETLLTRCPGLTIVATSREPLGVPGELVRPVEPLPPDPAHRLFTERALTVRPGFDAAQEQAAVAEICRRLDGLPLAIELAAARLRMLTPRQIADRLDDRFRLLTSGSRTVLPRQQTLRAVVDWSWDLLGEPERTVLREVSVFAGGWDLAAAEAVCTGPAADLTGALVDKSLIVAEPTADGDMRYRMLETIHEYASERAAETPDLSAAAGRRHTAYVRALVEEAEPLLRSADQLPWIQRLETDLDNIRAALQRAVASHDEEQALALALAMGWFWWLRNYRREGTEWIDRILRLIPGAPAPAAPPAPEDGSTAPAGPAFWAVAPAPESDLESAPAASIAPSVLDAAKSSFDHAPVGLDGNEDALFWQRMNLRLLHIFLVAESRAKDVLSGDGDREYITRIRDMFARPVPAAARFPGLIWPLTAYFLEGSAPDARSALDEGIANCRRYGGDWEIAIGLMFRTHMAVDTPGNLTGVDEDLAELRALSGRAGDRWLRAQVSSAAGEAAMVRGRHEDARAAYEEALQLAHEVGAHAETPFLIVRLAEIAYREGDPAAAAKALHEAGVESDRYGVADPRAFMRLLQGLMALEDGDIARARAMCDAAYAEAARGTPPPQFDAALRGFEAQVVSAESGPRKALPLHVEALRGALESHCAEVVIAALVDSGAALVSRTGDHRRAARLLAFGTRLRGGNPRPMPDLGHAEQIEAEAIAALGPERYETERAAGGELTAADVLAELTAAF
ncbi:winged helix-turn-helix domain-containing protein [Streptomyces sp. NBC_01381]|uniref:BTAD domain-containing putative transcriptional regulator n=1 Tax=Streptomyces sp. NBC_01381 TaxID=2903845 RepID=UPI0022572345|nr:BTAD domain-containing putative transcriptional regulator [Streptomyces sp. NBC_01381]MCX4666020.1 winged helix-turn-helix domain-containing protein [Streptomyces sp. NBC_01381]